MKVSNVLLGKKWKPVFVGDEDVLVETRVPRVYTIICTSALCELTVVHLQDAVAASQISRKLVPHGFDIATTDPIP